MIMKDIPRFCLDRFSRILRLRRFLFPAISKPSERLSIGTDLPGRLGNGGEAKATLNVAGISDEGARHAF